MRLPHYFSSALLLATLLFAGSASLSAGMLNLRSDFGAIGDGEADDTEALQKAFGSGRAVYIPVGDYRFTQTIRVRARTKIYGESGSWQPRQQAVLRYDGEEGAIALNATEAHHFQMRNVTVNAAHKADVGVYWNYSSNDALLEDVAIIGSRKHGLFLTKTWYASFTRLHVRRNLGAGVTIDRDTDPKYAKGPVNHVTFLEGIFHSNGLDDQYDGTGNIATGYGLGIFGVNAVVNFIGCSMEKNGGAGIYMEGAPTNILFSGNYIEHNTTALYRRLEKVYGKNFVWRTVREREPVGYMASIIDNTRNGRGPIVFDNSYVHPQNGIWLKGTGGSFPLVFRGMWHPAVYWSENANWVAYDSSYAPIAGNPGVIYRPQKGDLAATGGIAFFDPEGKPSGHPAYFVREGIRRLAPQLKNGLDLYVDTSSPDQHPANGDGRTWQTAFTSLQKAFNLLSTTQLDQQVRIHVKGEINETLWLNSLEGSGSVLVDLSAAQLNAPARISAVCVPLHLKGGDWHQQIQVEQSRPVRISNATFTAAAATGAPSGNPAQAGTDADALPALLARDSAVRISRDSAAIPAAAPLLVRADWASLIQSDSNTPLTLITEE